MLDGPSGDDPCPGTPVFPCSVAMGGSRRPPIHGMRTLALVNQKGGCGKTTTAVHLAGALASKGARTLLVDLDPQAHATLALGIGVEDEPTVADVLLGRAQAAEAVVPAPGGIRVLPAELGLAEFEETSARQLRPETILRERLASLRDEIDYVLLDCPPRVDGILATSAMRAADTIVLVVETGTFALQGANRALALLDELGATLEHEPEVRMVATLFDRRTRLARDLLVAMQARFGEAMYETVVHESARLRSAAAAGLPIQVLDRRCRAASDFAALAEEVMAGKGHDVSLAPATHHSTTATTPPDRATATRSVYLQPSRSTGSPDVPPRPPETRSTPPPEGPGPSPVARPATTTSPNHRSWTV